MNKIHETLKDLGFSQNEIDVYVAALQLGEVTATRLGSKIGIPRSTAQYTCQSLVKKGLLSLYSKDNSFIFSAESPEKLQSLLNKEYSNLERKTRNVQHIIGDLEQLINPYKSSPKVKYFQGVDGMIQLMEDVLLENTQLFGALELPEGINEEVNQYIETVYLPKKRELGFKSQMIFNDSVHTKKYQTRDEISNRKSRVISRELYPFDGCIHIYGNKVSFYSFKDNDLSGMLIEHEHIKNTMLSLFTATWDSAKEI